MERHAADGLHDAAPCEEVDAQVFDVEQRAVSVSTEGS
jgi:hypothetical protein